MAAASSMMDEELETTTSLKLPANGLTLYQLPQACKETTPSIHNRWNSTSDHNLSTLTALSTGFKIRPHRYTRQNFLSHAPALTLSLLLPYHTCMTHSSGTSLFPLPEKQHGANKPQYRSQFFGTGVHITKSQTESFGKKKKKEIDGLSSQDVV